MRTVSSQLVRTGTRIFLQGFGARIPQSLIDRDSLAYVTAPMFKQTAPISPNQKGSHHVPLVVPVLTVYPRRDNLKLRWSGQNILPTFTHPQIETYRIPLGTQNAGTGTVGLRNAEKNCIRYIDTTAGDFSIYCCC